MWIGVGLGEILANGGNPDLSIIWSPMCWGRCWLAALSALPIILNKETMQFDADLVVIGGSAGLSVAAGAVQ